MCSIVDCLIVMMGVLKSNTSSYAVEILERSHTIITTIFKYKS